MSAQLAAQKIVDDYRVGDTVTPAVLLAFAITYAAHGWEVFPLGRNKKPRIASPHPKGSAERRSCKGQCGLDGHGVHDATGDLTTICRWWAIDYRGAGIGGRVPPGMFVLDTDPRKPGHVEALAALVAEHGSFPHTAATLSGRLDGGLHRFYRRPAGKLTIERLGPGFDIKDHGGYVVLPPTLHDATGAPYIGVDAPIVSAGWLAKLIAAGPRPASSTPRSTIAGGSSPGSHPSPADWFCANTSWADVLMPHGWACLDADPDADGTRWLHPAATSDCSATIRNGCLFVYSTSTAFEPTGAGNPNGYTKFRAYAVLNFDNDLSEAARSLIRKVS